MLAHAPTCNHCESCMFYSKASFHCPVEAATSIVSLQQIWNVSSNISDEVTWFIDCICSLCWLWIFFLPRLVWLREFGALWAPRQSHTENHLGLHGEWWEMFALLCSETHRHLEVLAAKPCGKGYEMPHGRPVRGAGCTGVNKAQRLLCSEAQGSMLAEKMGQNIYILSMNRTQVASSVDIAVTVPCLMLTD